LAAQLPTDLVAADSTDELPHPVVTYEALEHLASLAAVLGPLLEHQVAVSDYAGAVALGQADDADNPAREVSTADLRSQNIELSDEVTAEHHSPLHDASADVLWHRFSRAAGCVVEGVEQPCRTGQVAAHLAQEGCPACVGHISLSTPLVASKCEKLPRIRL
jgi:hypothetical protein